MNDSEDGAGTSTGRERQVPKKRAIGRPRSSAKSVGRDALLALTCELLKTTHHKEISRASLARMAGVDPSLIRYYFNSMEDLLFAAAERLTIEFRSYFETALAATDGSPEARICARIHAIVELTATYPFYSRLIGEEVMHADNPLARSIFGVLMDRGIDGLAPVIAEGVAGNRFRPVDPKLLFSAIIGMGEFFLHTKRRGEVSSHPDDSGSVTALKARYKAFLCDLLFAGIMAGNDGLGRFDVAQFADLTPEPQEFREKELLTGA